MNSSRHSSEVTPSAAASSLILPFVPISATSPSSNPKLRSRRSFAASSASLVVIAPPSPEFTNFVACKLNTSVRPKLPIMRPWCEHPNAWAASKRSARPRRWAIAARASTSHGFPHRCTPRIPVVRGPINPSTDSGEILCVRGSTSQNTGSTPCHASACTVAGKVKDGTTTSPFSPKDRIAISSPVVALDTATQCATPR